ncbi:MAG: PQQ-binding-like beta-propeller repeat protein [Planctomycetota bacterium]
MLYRVFSLLVSVPLLAMPARSEDTWPRFLNVQFDGVSDSTAQIDWTKKPTLAWSIDAGEGYGIGSVADGRYLHFDSGPTENPSMVIERIRSVDMDDGSLQWVHKQPIVYRDLYGYEDGPRSSATVEGDQVFTLGVSGILTCRDLATGKQRWAVSTRTVYGVVQNFFGVGSSPLVLDDQVIVMVGGSPPEDQRIPPGRLDRVVPNGSALVSFDKATGKELWRAGDDLASYSSPRTIQLGDETLVLCYARDGLLAVDPSNGDVRWKFSHRAEILESVNAIVPVVKDDLVFVSECYGVGSALLKVTGQAANVVWRDPPRDRRRQAMRCHWSTPVFVDGYLYGCSGRNAPDSDFRCIAFDNGEVQWSDPRRVRSSVTKVGDHLVLLEERGAIQIIRPNPEKLEVIAEWNLSMPETGRPPIVYPCWAAPIVVGDKLMVRGDERVLCLQLQTQ